MQFINLTPHTVNIIAEDGSELLAIYASGDLARVSAETVVAGNIDGITITSTRYGEVQGLPEPQEGVAYIVSALVAQRVHGREDVFVPSESVRDSNGRIIGCRSLGRI